jgi:hypothetical protein
MMSMLPKTIHCADAHNYFKQVEQMGRRSWVFRGHSRFADDGPNNWKLESSLDRFLQNHRGKAIRSSSWYPRERDQIKRFRGAAHNHLGHLPDTSDKLAWLALMQHYGSPTRLLDFTFNPAAALYFALREAGKDSGPYSIHALHIDSVRGCAKAARTNLPRYQNLSPPMNPSNEEYGIGDKPADVDFVGFFDGSKLNPRQEAQDGLFIVPSRINLDIEDWLQKNLAPFNTTKPHATPWFEFVFNNEQDSYYKVVNQLVQVGMTAKRLFPGLEGICESMKHSWLEVVKDLEPFDL